MNLLKELDPEGVDFRKKEIKEAYDKLKPFGISIHGSIDGFSRRLVLLQVSSTIKNTQVIT